MQTFLLLITLFTISLFIIAFTCAIQKQKKEKVYYFLVGALICLAITISVGIKPVTKGLSAFDIFLIGVLLCWVISIMSWFKNGSK